MNICSIFAPSFSAVSPLEMIADREAESALKRSVSSPVTTKWIAPCTPFILLLYLLSELPQNCSGICRVICVKHLRVILFVKKGQDRYSIGSHHVQIQVAYSPKDIIKRPSIFRTRGIQQSSPKRAASNYSTRFALFVSVGSFSLNVFVNRIEVIKFS